MKQIKNLIVSKCKLEMCPHWTKMCPLCPSFGSIYPKNGVELAKKNGRVLDQKINFSNILISPKFKNDLMNIEVKKKNFYNMFNFTLDQEEDGVKYEVENFFFTSILIELFLNFGDIKM